MPSQEEIDKRHIAGLMATPLPPDEKMSLTDAVRIACGRLQPPSVSQPEICTAPVEIGDLRFDIIFAVEPCGSIPGRGHLYQYVCTACRDQNPRGRDEWVSSSFPDDMQADAIERVQDTFKEVQAHVRAHELIGAWLMAQLKKEAVA
jgi:hypothetical protein